MRCCCCCCCCWAFPLLLLLPSPNRIIKPYSFLSMGILLANVLGAPLAAGFLAMDGLGGE
jgi:hypothetical protein